MPLDLEHKCSAVRVMRYRRFVGLPDAIPVVILAVVVGMPPHPRSGHVLAAL